MGKNNPAYKVTNYDNGKKLVATKTIKINEVILEFEKNFVSEPNRYTLQIDENIHQSSTDPDLAENFINHSCAPNSFVDFSTLELKALRSISKGEDITYNYFTSDYEMEDAFECCCKSENCKKNIYGFKNLTLEEKIELQDYLSPFLRSKLEAELSDMSKKTEAPQTASIN